MSDDAVRKWAERGGWHALRDKTRQALTDKAQPVLAMQVAGDLARQSEQVRQSLAAELNSQVAILGKQRGAKAKDLAGKNGRAQTAKTIADTAARVFDWDAAQAGNAVSLTFLTQINVGPQPAERPQDAIDVEETPQQVVASEHPKDERFVDD